MTSVGENELTVRVALPYLFPKCVSAMVRMLALQFYSWELAISRSASRKNVETSVAEEGRQTVKCVSDVRGTSPALQTVTGHVIAATNAIIALPAASLTRSAHTGRLDKLPDIVTNSTATYIGKYTVRNTRCSNVLGQCGLCVVYRERRSYVTVL